MATKPEAHARTRAFARVLGPYLVIVPGLIVAKLPEAVTLAPAFFSNPALVFIMGALMVFGGIFMIANHSFWRGASAILISLFGWILALRGLVLLLAPEFYERALRQDAEGGTPLARGAGLAVFLGSSLSDGITGKLISAVWDPWQTLGSHLADLQSSDVYTLRRIAPKDRGLDW